VSSAASATLTLTAKDSGGNAITTGGATVVFSRAGGTSTGTISATTDHNNGTYTATFTGDTAGTATTIRATIGGVLATSTTTITVVPGNSTAARSVITVSKDTVASGAKDTLTLQAKDSAGNNLTTGGLVVVFSHAGGTSSGSISAVTDNNNGKYTAVFTADTAGTETTIHATIGGQQVTSTLPTVTVIAGAISTAKSIVTSSDSVTTTGGTLTLTLTAKDAAGNALTKGGSTVVFTQGGGTSTGTIAPSPATDNNTGSYTATFTGVNGGTATTIGATIGGVAVTSAPLPTIRVLATVHSTDITASETWFAGTHTVTAPIRVRNGATLTIALGATVKFDAGAGLQIGDTTLNQSGGLIMDGTQPGTAPGITLTANTGSPAPGFWKGIEVQRNVALTTWRRALIEWAGGTRAAFGSVATDACVLFVNRLGAEVDLDSVRIRQCVHAGVHHFGGASHIHRSEIDTVTGSAIHADFDARLELDSTVLRGSANDGLEIPSPAVTLLPSSGNAVFGSGSTAIVIQGAQLPGMLRQDTIGGNSANIIDVIPGAPVDTSFTLFRQPRGFVFGNDYDYRIDGLLQVGGALAPQVTLDSNVVLRFFPQGGLVIGDSSGTAAATIRSLGTNRANAPVLTSINTPGAPGQWYGLEIGRLAGNARLANLRVEFAGDSIPGRSRHRFGLLVRSPAAHTLALDSVLVVQSGLAGSDTNSAGIGVLGSGAGVDIRRSVAQGNPGYGFAIGGVQNIKVVGDTAKSNTAGFGVFTDSGGSGASAPGDSIASNVATGNALYPLQIDVRRLPVLFANSFAGNGRDTLLLSGGASLSHSAALVKMAGVPWRVTQLVQIDSGAVLTLAPRDTIAFDSLAGFVVGDSAPAALRAVSSGGPVLLTPAAGNTHWFGLQFQQLSQPDTLMNVVIEKAGFVGGGCQIACDVQFLVVFGSVNYTNTTAHPLVLDSVTIRQAVGYAVSSTPSGSGAVRITHSQFYDNPYLSAFNASSGLALSIDSSDIYHYRPGFGQPVIVNKSVDSVTARHNWWGDLSGPGVATVSNPPPDSIGRALLDEPNFPVAYQPFAVTPYFTVAGPSAAVVGTPDSVLLPVQTGSQLPDSVRVRTVDASGRGVSGQPVTWSAGPGNGTLAPTSGTTDIGGRHGAHWTLGAQAKTDTAKATSGGFSTHLFVDVLPGPTTTVSWELLPGLTQGAVSADSNTVTFTSTGRRGVILTHALDANGNPTQPSFTPQFEDVPTPSGFQPYGTVDSSKGDTIFFHTTVTTPASFQLHGTYTGVSGNLEDSVFIDMNAQAKGLQINQDTAQFNSLCPTGPVNSACSRPFFAELIDSAGTPLPPSGAFVIQWAKVTGAGTAVTIDSTRGVMGEIAWITAQQNGPDAVLAHQVQGPFGLVPSADTLAITVQQVPFQILINPASTPAGLGDTVTFTAVVSDLGGAAVVPSPAIHWRADPPYTGFVTFIDTTTTNGVAKIRLDSVYQSFFQLPVDVITALAARGPGDTLVHFTQLVNPIQVDTSGVGSNPFATAVNPQTGHVYVVNQFTNPGLVQIFDSTPANIATVQVDMGPHGIAVNPVTNRVYTANQTSETVSIIDGSTNALISSFIPLGPNSGAIAVDTATGLVYASGEYCFDFPATCSTPFLKIINGTALADSIQLPADGRGIAVQYNTGGERIFVSLANDSLVVINPVTKTITDTIAFPSGSFLMGVAVNSITKRVYVAEYSASQIGVIDGTPGVDTLFTNTSISVNNPNFVSVNEKRNLVYSAASSNNFVLELDGATNSIRHEYVIGQFNDFPQDAAINAADQRVYVPHATALTLLKFFTH
jgi:YVTN family beta-propeller protein